MSQEMSWNAALWRGHKTETTFSAGISVASAMLCIACALLPEAQIARCLPAIGGPQMWRIHCSHAAFQRAFTRCYSLRKQERRLLRPLCYASVAALMHGVMWRHAHLLAQTSTHMQPEEVNKTSDATTLQHAAMC